MSAPYGLEHVNYYYLTDERMDLAPAEQVEIAVEAGVRMVQYRCKSGSTRRMYEEALQIAKVCEGRAIFIVNDRLDIALAVGADGVHVGQNDLPYHVVRKLIGEKILGVSTHNIRQARSAQGPADYIGIGPLRATKTKKDHDPELGVEGVVEIAEEVAVPCAAIGGVTERDIESLSPHVDMICAVSSVTRCGDLFHNIKRFEEKIRKVKEVPL